MLAWILKDAEPLPLQAAQRPLRSGLLAQELGRRGHHVTWWTSTFSHHHKNFIFEQDTRIELMPNVTLLALDAGRYQRNISLARLRHHRRLGRRFREMAPAETPPDIIVSALPILDFPFEAAHFCSERDIPLVVDVRDPWPDVFADKAPAMFRPLVRLLTLTERRRACHSLKSAVAITAVSKGFLRWGLRLAGRKQSPQDRVFYLGHSGFDSGLKESLPSAELGKLLKSKLVFTFVGSFGHSYELDLVARAARHFSTRRPDITFVLVGDGGQRKVLQTTYGDLQNLLLTGWLDTRQISAVLAHSQVGLVPCQSLPDTVPNKPFEYLAAGLPLLSSLEGEMEELIENHGLGLSYRAGDLTGFTRAVERIWDERLVLEKWSANARKVFEENFSAKRIYPNAATHVEEMAKLATGRNAARG